MQKRYKNPLFQDKDHTNEAISISVKTEAIEGPPNTYVCGPINKPKKKYKPSTDSEDKIQADCFMWAHNSFPIIRGLLFHIPNGGTRGAISIKAVQETAVISRTIADFCMNIINIIKASMGREGNKFKAMGVVPGVPDMFLSIPAKFHSGNSPINFSTETFHGLYIEMKTPIGKLSPEQKEIHAKLIKAGYMIHVCRSLIEFKEIFINYINHSEYKNK